MRPGRQDNDPGCDLRTVREDHHPIAATGSYAGRRSQHRRFGAERPGLVQCPIAELGAPDAQRKAQIVADQGARAGLATNRLPIDHDRA